MFSGGGANWADREMKAGRFLVDAGAAGRAARPDGPVVPLPADARASGVILSIIALPREDADPALRRARRAARRAARHPGPRRPPGPGRRTGMRHGRRPRWRWRRGPRRRPAGGCAPRARALAQSGFAVASDRTGRPIGGFDAPPALRRREPERRLPQVRRRAEADGRRPRCGLRADRGAARRRRARRRLPLRHLPPGRGPDDVHRPLAPRRDHVHFVDGAAGGYAMAAAMLKRRAEPVGRSDVGAAARASPLVRQRAARGPPRSLALDALQPQHVAGQRAPAAARRRRSRGRRAARPRRRRRDRASGEVDLRDRRAARARRSAGAGEVVAAIARPATRSSPRLALRARLASTRRSVRRRAGTPCPRLRADPLVEAARSQA